MIPKQIYLTEDLIKKVQCKADESSVAPCNFSAALRAILDDYFNQREQNAVAHWRGGIRVSHPEMGNKY
jgi:hypothetical protein